MKNIAIIGSGTWGVALAIHLSRMGNKIKIWSFSEEEANTLNTERKCKFLPEAVIDENITCYTDMKTVIDGSDIILHVTPSKFVRETIKKYEKYVKSL